MDDLFQNFTTRHLSSEPHGPRGTKGTSHGTSTLTTDTQRGTTSILTRIAHNDGFNCFFTGFLILKGHDVLVYGDSTAAEIATNPTYAVVGGVFDALRVATFALLDQLIELCDSLLEGSTLLFIRLILHLIEIDE